MIAKIWEIWSAASRWHTWRNCQQAGRLAAASAPPLLAVAASDSTVTPGRRATAHRRFGETSTRIRAPPYHLAPNCLYSSHTARSKSVRTYAAAACEAVRPAVPAAPPRVPPQGFLRIPQVFCLPLQTKQATREKKRGRRQLRAWCETRTGRDKPRNMPRARAQNLTFARTPSGTGHT